MRLKMTFLLGILSSEFFLETGQQPTRPVSLPLLMPRQAARHTIQLAIMSKQHVAGT